MTLAELSFYGEAVPYCDGTASVYIKNMHENTVALLTLADEDNVI